MDKYANSTRKYLGGILLLSQEIVSSCLNIANFDRYSWFDLTGVVERMEQETKSLVLTAEIALPIHTIRQLQIDSSSDDLIVITQCESLGWLAYLL